MHQNFNSISCGGSDNELHDVADCCKNIADIGRRLVLPVLLALNIGCRERDIDGKPFADTGDGIECYADVRGYYIVYTDKTVDGCDNNGAGRPAFTACNHPVNSYQGSIDSSSITGDGSINIWVSPDSGNWRISTANNLLIDGNSLGGYDFTSTYFCTDGSFVAEINTTFRFDLLIIGKFRAANPDESYSYCGLVPDDDGFEEPEAQVLDANFYEGVYDSGTSLRNQQEELRANGDYVGNAFLHRYTYGGYSPGL